MFNLISVSLAALACFNASVMHVKLYRFLSELEGVVHTTYIKMLKT
jgi:hypothetical protein